MTRQRNHKASSTAFGLWLREEKEIDSDLGFSSSDIDYVLYIWHDYGKTASWMFLEEKTHSAEPTWSQQQLFKIVDDACRRGDPNYKGFHVLTFENTSPEDGQMTLDGTSITIDELLEFLKFEKTASDLAREHVENEWYSG